MGGLGVASLFAVREGADWRVQIVWQNGIVHISEDLLLKRMRLPGLPLMVGLKTTPPEKSPEAGSSEFSSNP